MAVLKRRVVVAVLVALVTGVPVDAAAQSVSGSITGTVVDQTRQLVPGATVTLVNEQTADVRATSSNETGAFVFSAVQPGTYTVRVELTGFASFELRHIVVPASEQVPVGPLQLNVGTLTETVTATSTGSFVQTLSSDRSALITSTQIEQVADRGRDVVSLLRVLPGVAYQTPTDSPGGNFGSTTPNINGTRATWNTMTVDGVVGNDLGSPQIFSSSINFDAIGEVQVELNNYRAEYGRNGGPVINIVTKSGTKDYKGSAYWYKRNEALNANDFFNNKNGIAKPIYRFDTVGGTFGGPVPLPKSGKSKLFFFYSFDGLKSLNPRPLQQVTTPTALERTGDFSQSLDTNGRLIIVRDPLTGLPFAGNVIPTNRINHSGQALLGVFPLPNALDRTVTRGAYNYNFQESLDVPKRQNVIRMDFHPTPKDAFYGRVSTWYGDNQGYNVAAGGAAWGLVRLHYLFTDDSGLFNYTRVVSNTIVNEASVSIRHSTENGPPLSDADLAGITKGQTGFTLGQLFPSINPLGIIPQARFTGVTGAAAITYDGRTPLTGDDKLYTFNDTLTMVRGTHTFKAGMYVEHVRNEEGPTATFAGLYDFSSTDANNPGNTGFAYANALLGNFTSYTESTTRPGGGGLANVAEWFVQDTWRLTPKLTLDYGLRLAWYTQYRHETGGASAFSLDRYSAAKAPRLYFPALVNNVRVGRDLVTGATVPAVLIGALVPGTGDLNNGIVLGTDSSYPAGFKDQAPLLPEPRAGFAYDLSGDGKTAVRGSFGLFHNTRLSGNVNWQATRNPPLQLNPQIFYGSMDTLLQSTGYNFPSDVQGFEKETRTPTLYGYSIGLQRDIGWGTVVDAAFVGSQSRNLLQTRNLNIVPYGAHFLPENQDPTRANVALPDNFYRPFPGYANVWFFENSGKADYQALQLQANRRFKKGLQFGVAYTLSRSRDYSSNNETGTGANMQIATYQNPDTWNWGLSSYDQTHVAVINYTWDLPQASARWNNAFTRAVLDNWQFSGLTTLASGTPVYVTFTTVDGADITGGGDVTRFNGGPGAVTPTAGSGVPNLVGDPNLPSSERSLTQWFNTAAFARPAKGDPGNSPKDVIRGPGVTNSDVTLFKNIPFGASGRKLQLRWEIYNVFNQVQFATVDSTARFDAAGNQVNTRFGQVITTRAPRVMQVALRVVF
jgi:carboxypeptidase family protein/TonB-dependent receptor-like protein